LVIRCRADQRLIGGEPNKRESPVRARFGRAMTDKKITRFLGLVLAGLFVGALILNALTP
jgi:hypothetical protein